MCLESPVLSLGVWSDESTTSEFIPFCPCLPCRPPSLPDSSFRLSSAWPLITTALCLLCLLWPLGAIIAIPPRVGTNTSPPSPVLRPPLDLRHFIAAFHLLQLLHKRPCVLARGISGRHVSHCSPLLNVSFDSPASPPSLPPPNIQNDRVISHLALGPPSPSSPLLPAPISPELESVEGSRPCAGRAN